MLRAQYFAIAIALADSRLTLDRDKAEFANELKKPICKCRILQHEEEERPRCTWRICRLKSRPKN